MAVGPDTSAPGKDWSAELAEVDAELRELEARLGGDGREGAGGAAPARPEQRPAPAEAAAGASSEVEEAAAAAAASSPEEEGHLRTCEEDASPSAGEREEEEEEEAEGVGGTEIAAEGLGLRNVAVDMQELEAWMSKMGIARSSPAPPQTGFQEAPFAVDGPPHAPSQEEGPTSTADAYEMPSPNVHATPSPDMDEMPSPGVDEMPSRDADEMPLRDAEETPSPNAHEMPSPDVDEMPVPDAYERLSPDADKMPSSDADEMPSPTGYPVSFTPILGMPEPAAPGCGGAPPGSAPAVAPSRAAPDVGQDGGLAATCERPAAAAPPPDAPDGAAAGADLADGATTEEEAELSRGLGLGADLADGATTEEEAELSRGLGLGASAAPPEEEQEPGEAVEPWSEVAVPERVEHHVDLSGDTVTAQPLGMPSETNEVVGSGLGSWSERSVGGDPLSDRLEGAAAVAAQLSEVPESGKPLGLDSSGGGSVVAGPHFRTADAAEVAFALSGEAPEVTELSFRLSTDRSTVAAPLFRTTEATEVALGSPGGRLAVVRPVSDMLETTDVSEPGFRLSTDRSTVVAPLFRTTEGDRLAVGAPVSNIPVASDVAEPTFRLSNDRSRFAGPASGRSEATEEQRQPLFRAPQADNSSSDGSLGFRALPRPHSQRSLRSIPEGETIAQTPKQSLPRASSIDSISQQSISRSGRAAAAGGGHKSSRPQARTPPKPPQPPQPPQAGPAPPPRPGRPRSTDVGPCTRQGSNVRAPKPGGSLPPIAKQSRESPSVAHPEPAQRVPGMTSGSRGTASLPALVPKPKATEEDLQQQKMRVASKMEILNTFNACCRPGANMSAEQAAAMLAKLQGHSAPGNPVGANPSARRPPPRVRC